jgi:hypothetical protein
MGSVALLPLGYLLAGPVAAVVGEPEVMIGGGLLGLAAMGLALIPNSVRTLTRIEPDEARTEPAALQKSAR